MATIQNSPVYSLPFLYISGLDLSVASTKIIAIAPGQARDSNDVIDMPVSFSDLQGQVVPAVQYLNYQQPLLVNAESSGANGLDQGSLAASTQYAIYLIGDSRGYKPVAGIMSLSSNAYPLMPSGYDSYRLLGFASTNSSSNFVFSTNPVQMMKNASSYYLSGASAALSGGTSTSFAEVDLNSYVPLASLPNVIVQLLVTYIPASAGSYVQFRPADSSATSGLVTISAQSAGVAQTQYVQVIAGPNGSSHTALDYKVSSSSDSLSFSVVGYMGAPLAAYPS